MAANEKPIRYMDSILVRMPDGMKDRLAQRARANGRSMNAELVAIISESLEEVDALGVRRLREKLQRIEMQIEAKVRDAEELRAQRAELEKEIYLREDAQAYLRSKPIRG